MFSTLDTDTGIDVLARLDAVLDDLAALDVTCLPGDELLGFLQALETRTRRLPTADHRLVAEIDSRGLAHDRGRKDTVDLLRELLRISPGEASGRVRSAAGMGPRHGLSGEALGPIYGQVAAAQGAGVISPAHARIITSTIEALPDAAQAEHDLSIEALLVEHATKLDPAQLALAAHRISDTLNPDGTKDTERDRARKRGLHIARRRDGSGHLTGVLTALCTEALLVVLDGLAKPTPETEGTKDPRSAGQRNHDGLYDALLVLLRADLVPDANGVAATIVFTITPAQFESGTGLVRTGHGAYLTVGEALTLFGDSRVIPVVLGKTKQITEYGTTHRIFTEAQRLAMIARDLGCSFPGCDQPPSRCEAHHITDYTLTRRTSVDDGTLLCGPHHRNHPRLGWICQMINGIPHWTPPPWLDHTQTPRRNTMHDPLDT